MSPGYRSKEEEGAAPWWQLWGGGAKAGRRGDEGSPAGGGNSDSCAAAAYNAAGSTGAGRRDSKDVARISGEGGEGAVLWAAQPGSTRRGAPRQLSILLQQSLSGSATQAQELAALSEMQEQQQGHSHAHGVRPPSRNNYLEPGHQESETLSRPASGTTAAAFPPSTRPASSHSGSRTAAAVQYGRVSSTDTGASGAMAGEPPRARTLGGSYDSWKEPGSPGLHGEPRSAWRRAAEAAALEEGGDAGAVDDVLGRPDLDRPAGPHNMGVPPARGVSFAAAAAAAAALAAAERGVPSPAHGARSPWSPSTAAAGGARSSSGASPWVAESASPHAAGAPGIRAGAAAGAPCSAPASPGATGLAPSRSAWRRAAEAAAVDAGGTEGTVREVCGSAPERSASTGGLVQVRPGSARARPVPLRPSPLSPTEGVRAYTEGGQGGASAGIRSSPLGRGNGGSTRFGGGGDSPGAVREAGAGSRTHFGAMEAQAATELPWRWPSEASGAAKDGASGSRSDSWAGHNPLFRQDGSRSDSDGGEDAGRDADPGGSMSLHGAEQIGGGRGASVRFRGMRDSEGEEAGSPHGHDSRLVYVQQQSGGSSRAGSPARVKSAWRVAVDSSAAWLQPADGESGFVMGAAPLRPKSGRRSAVLSETAGHTGGPSTVPLSTAATAAGGGSARGSPRTASSLATATPMPDEGTEGGMPWSSSSGSQKPSGSYAQPVPAAGNAGGRGFLAQRLAGGGMRESELGADMRGSGSAALDAGQYRAPAIGERQASSGQKAVAWASEVSTRAVMKQG